MIKRGTFKQIWCVLIGSPIAMTKKPDLAAEQWKAMAAGLRAKAEQLSPGPDRDELLREVRRLETACNMSDWAFSPGLRPPKS